MTGRPTSRAKLGSALRVLRRRSRQQQGEQPTSPTSALVTSGRQAESEEQLPEPRPRRAEVTAAVAAGPRLRTGLAWEWQQRDLEPAGWREVLAAKPDLVLVELTRSGVPGWKQVDELVAGITESGVDLVVWVTDAVAPSSAAALAGAAKAIFLHDASAVETWRAEYPDVTVEVLPPAAQPFVHNPVNGGPGDRRPTKGVLLVDEQGFGAAEAKTFTEVVAAALKPIKSAEFDVWTTGQRPEELDGAKAKVRETVDHARSVGLASSYRVLLDAGRSHPAAAWTALEAGAAQTAVVSLPQYREAMPPEVAEHVAAQSTEKELRGEVNARIWQTELRDREALRLHRAVLAGHTYDHRARSILGALGKTTERPSRSVSAVAPTNRAHEIGNIFDNMGRQAYPELELVLVLHGLDVDDAELQAQAADKGVKNLTIVHADKSLTLGMCMNRGIEAASGAYIAKIDDDNFYGKHYLTDLMAAFDYTDAGVVGKWGHYVWLRSTDAVVLRYPDAEHTYERRIQGGSMLIEGDLARSLKFSDIPRAVDSDFLDRAIADGVRIYSGDRFNFVSVRGSDRTSHTWQVHDVTFMTKTGRLVFFGDPRVHVEV